MTLVLWTEIVYITPRRIPGPQSKTEMVLLRCSVNTELTFVAQAVPQCNFGTILRSRSFGLHIRSDRLLAHLNACMDNGKSEVTRQV